MFVTGGASGIGAAIVAGFLDQGASVATVDLRDAADLPSDVWYQRCDVRDTDPLQTSIDTAASAIGPIRVLVNNVARDDRFDNRTMPQEQWDEMQAVNLRHVYFASQAVRSGMAAAGGGSIINFTSPSFEKKDPNLVAYATAKAGIVGLTRTLAADLGAEGIRVNAVMPGWVFTERQRRLWVTDENEAAVLRDQLLPSLATEEDVARVVLFLGADDSSAVTAAVYHVDAGWA